MMNKQVSQESYNPYLHAAVYARTSIKAANYSIDAQISDCKKRLFEENLLLYNVYTDKESGTKFRFYERKGFKQLMNAMEAGMFKTVIISKRDRLSRNVSDFIHLKHLFKKYNTRVIFSKELDFVDDDDSYISRFLDNMLVALATLEPNTIAKRTSDGKKHSREQGKFTTGNTPYGYYKNTESKCYKIDTAQAANVKLVFEKFSQVSEILSNKTDYSLSDFKDDMKQLFPNKNSGAVEFAYEILQRPVYIGKITIEGQTPLCDLIESCDIDGTYTFKDSLLIPCTNLEKILDDEQLWKYCLIKFYKLVYLNRNFKKKSLLTNIVFCNSCHKVFRLKWDHNISTSMYSCSDNCVCIPENKLLKLVFSKLLIDTDNSIFENHLNSKLKKINALVITQQKSLQKLQQNNFRREIQNYINSAQDGINQDSFLEKLQDYKSKEKQLIAIINSLGNEKLCINNILSNIQLYKENLASSISDKHIEFFKGSGDILNELLRKIIKRVVLLSEDNYEYSIKVQFKS